jgi:hypothetical protein
MERPTLKGNSHDRKPPTLSSSRERRALQFGADGQRARITHPVAIANSRLLACEDGRVLFRRKDYRDGGNVLPSKRSETVLTVFTYDADSTLQPRSLLMALQPVAQSNPAPMTRQDYLFLYPSAGFWNSGMTD